MTMAVLGLLAAFAVAGACRSASAALIAYDPLNQASGGGINGTASTSPGVWPTAQNWGSVVGTVDITSGSLSVPGGVVGLSTNGNSATLSNSGSQVAAFRSFGTSYSTASDTNLWFSFLYRPGGSGGVGINEGISLFNSGTEALFFGSDGSGDLVIRAVNGQSSSAANQFANTLVDATSNQTFQIVANIQGNTGYTIWVNPTGFNSGSGTPTGGITASLTSNLTTFAFDSIRLGDDDTSSPQGVATFDEFRMATTAAEVVPEPSTWALALGGLAAFAWQRSRRCRRAA
ncbi:MAG: hypothetical protein RLZZ440_1027 [Planctomycetota bacterium]